MPSLLWIVLPYAAFLSFGLGHVWRYRHDRFRDITTLTETDRAHRLGWMAFRTGFAVVITARLTDLIISGPHSHPTDALYAGLVLIEVAGVLAATGAAVLLFLPDLIAAPPRAGITPLDRLTLPALAAGLLSGVIVRFDPNSTANQYRTAETLFAWARSLVVLHPDTDAISHAPFIYQARGLILLLIIGIWPYTRLSGTFAGPIVRRARRFAIARRARGAAPDAVAGRMRAARFSS
ncbi:respiratory nitrate reductase subunit gamma [Nocardia sp. NPDC050710]|uniref:respiratory nitrate reductase subunit gamma n=1 Tax=Nocardia sp. NPDC050710 TaxID=3157220 RepID=UPI0033EEF905